MNDVAWDAWLAGMIDGEGCLTINEQLTTNPARSSAHWANLAVVNTDKAALDEMQTREGGSLYRKRQSSLRHKECWAWNLCSQQLVDLLRRIRAHLRVKREQAWLVLEFDASRSDCRGIARPTPEELALRAGFRLALQNAKLGG